MLCYLIFGLLLPSFVFPQASHCHRCFGSTWCNNFTDPSFAANVDIVECPTTNTYSFEGTNPYAQSLLDSIRTVAEGITGPENYEGSLMGCVTATVHEVHEDHTVRICMNQAAIICPTLSNVVLSNVNDISPDVRLSCHGCTGDLCNDHTFLEDEPPITTPSPVTTLSTTESSPPSTESSTVTSESSPSSDPTSSSTESSTASSELTTGTTTETEEATTRAPGSGHVVTVSNLIVLMTIVMNVLI